MQVENEIKKGEKEKQNITNKHILLYKQVAEPTDILYIHVYYVPVVAFVTESTWCECLVIGSSFFLYVGIRTGGRLTSVQSYNAAKG